MKLETKTAVVTGASSGIGRGIAIELAKAGADVAVGDRRRHPKIADGPPTAASIRELGREAIFRETDVARTEDVETLVAAAVSELGGVDIVVNNAGITHAGTVETTDEEEWNRVLDVNLTGVFACSKAAIPHLKESDSPRIINVASQLGIVARPRRPAYCASKGGVINLTRQLALDYADVPILVNAICPGVTRTAMTAPLLDDDDERAAAEANTPLPYFGAPEDIGRAAVFLASDDARFITGESLVIDGGYTAQ